MACGNAYIKHFVKFPDFLKTQCWQPWLYTRQVLAVHKCSLVRHKSTFRLHLRALKCIVVCIHIWRVNTRTVFLFIRHYGYNCLTVKLWCNNRQNNRQNNWHNPILTPQLYKLLASTVHKINIKLILNREFEHVKCFRKFQKLFKRTWNEQEQWLR